MTSAPTADGVAAAPRSRVVLARTSQAARRGLVVVGDAWRRSLQLRVGATTVVVAGIVTLVIGVFLVDKVAGGVLRAKRDAAVDQARVGLSVATDVLQRRDPTVAEDLQQASLEIAARLSGSTAGTFQTVLLPRAIPGQNP